MLGPDLVRAQRRGDELKLKKFGAAERERAEELAADILALLSTMSGGSEEEVEEALARVDRLPEDEKLFAGLSKLALDACDFGERTALEPRALRRELFERASRTRYEREDDQVFERSLVVEVVAEGFGITSSQLEASLFGDLKGAHELVRPPVLTASALLAAWEVAQIQGVLLRAERLRVEFLTHDPELLRALFRRLKFRQLLFELSVSEGHLVLLIDGPLSVLETSTRYGLALALLVPSLAEFPGVSLVAEVRWGKERRPLSFRAKLDGLSVPGEATSGLRPELAGLLGSQIFEEAGWACQVGERILNIPGVGVVVPDLTFCAKDGRVCHFELLGMHSREAVWRRVEWAERNTGERVVFAVSSRLRVSEEVLGAEHGASLYVFKGTLSPKKILGVLDRAIVAQ